jgi:hypothetical protein
MRRIAGSLLFALVLCAGTAAPASAQSYAQQVWNQLQRVYDVADGNAYSLRNYIIGKLNNGARDTWTFTLEANTSYLITGACDNDCSDLDIFINDPSGTQVAKDDTADDIPVVRFDTRGAGRYTVEIRMYACSANPCYFGFGIFQR